MKFTLIAPITLKKEHFHVFTVATFVAICAKKRAVKTEM